MGIPYAGGTNVSNSVTLGAGTESKDLCTAINTALVAAGWTSTSVRATSTITFTGQPANTETVTCGGKTYTFQSVLTNVDGNVLIGATTADSISNLVAAIGLGAGSGTTYAAATTANPGIQVQSSSTTTIVVEDKTAVLTNVGTAVSDTITNASWSPSTLQGGGWSLLSVESPSFQQMGVKFLINAATGSAITVTPGNRDFTRTGDATESDINGAQVITGRTFRIIANKYQYIIFVPSLANNAQNGTHTAGGTLSIPSFQACKKISNATNATPIKITTTAAHGYTTGQTVTVKHVLGNTAANTTTTITVTSTTEFTLDATVGSGAYTSGGVVGNDTLGEIWECVWAMCNQASAANWRTSMVWNTSGAFIALNGSSFQTAGGTGSLGPCQTVLGIEGSTAFPLRYQNGDYLVMEPWAAAAPTSGGSPRILGQVWDSVFISKDYPADTVQTFDSRNWWVLTDSASSFVPGTWLVVVP